MERLVKEHRVRCLIAQAINAQIEKWDAESEIERLLGHEIDELGETIREFAVCTDLDVRYDDKMIDEVLKELTTDET